MLEKLSGRQRLNTTSSQMRLKPCKSIESEISSIGVSKLYCSPLERFCKFFCRVQSSNSFSVSRLVDVDSVIVAGPKKQIHKG